MPLPPRTHPTATRRVGAAAAFLVAATLAVGGCAKPKSKVYRFDAGGPTPAAVAEADRLRELALKKIADEEREEAVPLLQEAVRLNPADGAALNNLGWLHQRAGRLYPAAVAYRRASEERPGDPVPLSNLGLVLGAAGRWGDAADLQEEALGLRPDDARFQTRWVYACFRRGDAPLPLREALEHVVLGMREGGWAAWAQQQLARLDPPAGGPAEAGTP